MTAKADSPASPGASAIDARPEDRRDPGPVASPLRWIVAHFEELVTAILLAVMLGSVGLSVFCRYALDAPLSWTEEVVLICMVWTCFLGASIATKHREHIVIDLVVTLVPRRLGRAMEAVSLLVIVVILAVVVWQGIRLLDVTRHVTTTALGIPTVYMYAAVPVSGFFMLLHNLRLLSGMLRR